MTHVVGEGPSFRLERSDADTTLVVTGSWTVEARDALKSGMASGLDLNYAKGFKDTGLGFLEDWPLKRLTLLARTVKDLSPLYRFANTLESLSVESAPSAKIDLALLPFVTSLSANWTQIRESIEQARQLEQLFVGSYAEGDLAPLQRNMLLRRLRMKDRPRLRSLDGIEALTALEHLGIYLATALDDIDALRKASMTGLRELHLESCRGLADLTSVAACRALRFLNVSECGDIESLAPLEALREAPHPPVRLARPPLSQRREAPPDHGN